MKLQALEAHLTVCKVAQVSPEMLTEGLCFLARTDEELSLVCETRNAPSHTLAREDGWRAFRVVGELDFSLVGILARLSAVLSQEKIGIFAVSTYNTDYILTKEESFENALAALSRASYEVIR